jgi:PleD family two-component response regulator
MIVSPLRGAHRSYEIPSIMLAPPQEHIDAMSKPMTGRKKSILVIVGQPTIRDVLDRFLRAGGYLVMTAADFEEGLSKVGLLPISLIVFGVDVLGSKAGEARARLKSETATAYVPVLLISSQLYSSPWWSSSNHRCGILEKRSNNL